MLEPYQERVISLDLNKEHFQHAGANRIVGSFLNVPLKDESVDYANLNFALHYTQFAPSRGNFERLEVLMELNRVLKVGGMSLINMIYTLDYKDETSFRGILYLLGFDVIEESSGEIEVGKNYRSNLITIRKRENLPVKYGESEAVEEMLMLIGKENFKGMKLKEGKAGLKDSRKVIQSFNVQGQKVDIEFNQQDSEVLTEEQDVEAAGLKLKNQYGGIEKIPREEIIDNGFTRILLKDKYILFKRLVKGEGVVVIK
jgi:SAM-dependent methyltransferase